MHSMMEYRGVIGKILAVILIGALMLPLVGCTAPAATGREIRIAASEFKFEPREIRVKAGETVSFVIVNTGMIDHEFESDDAKIAEVTIPPGRQRVVHWKAPARPGEYAFVCDLPGHKDAGMVGKIIVK